MKLSFNWLADYVDLSGLNPGDVAEKLTMRAFEVEDISVFGANITGPIVIGEIVDIQAHPDPKVTKMRLTKVKVDDKQEPLEIVCGASNIAIGQRVPVALPGSIVVNRHDGTAFPIIAMEKRGVRSNGMICAASELGITYGAEEDGILALDPILANQLGSDAYNLLCLEQDHVLNVGSRSNRGDAVCVRGMAREVAALFERPLRESQWQLQEGPSDDKKYTVKIADGKDCDYFSIRAISGIKIAPSPPFIARRLSAVGIRLISNIVDITNYVMCEWGQPMHAYDARFVKDGEFHIRRGKKEEKFITLDGKERILSDEMLVISDGEKVIGSPVMGGANSEINDRTTEIALEAASFNSTLVRRTSRLLGLSSESTLRFERGIDSTTTKRASDRAAFLISQYCANGNTFKVGQYVAGGQAEHPTPYVDLRLSEIKRHLNLDLSATQVKILLSRLEFSATESASTPEKLVFAVPSFRRNDVQKEIDLVEEVCRIYGYDNIPEEPPAFLSLTQMPNDICSDIRQSFAAQGLCEAYISSLIPDQNDLVAVGVDNPIPNTEQKYCFGDYNFKRSIKMLNPLSKDHQLMRQSLMPGLLNAFKYNYDRSEKNVWLFEIGNAYFKHLDNEQIERSTPPAHEERKVAGVLSGNRQLSIWREQNEKNISSSNSMDFYAVKGMLENLFSSLHIPPSQITYTASPNTPTLLHPGQAAKITHICEKSGASIDIGWLGQLHPALVQNLNFDPATYIFELQIDALDKISHKPRFQSLPTLLPVSRDLTVDLPQETSNASVVSCIKAAATHLSAIDLVSTFSLNNESKSFSYRLTFQSDEETFKGEEIEKIMNNIRALLKEKLSASFRG